MVVDLLVGCKARQHDFRPTTAVARAAAQDGVWSRSRALAAGSTAQKAVQSGRRAALALAVVFAHATPESDAGLLGPRNPGSWRDGDQKAVGTNPIVSAAGEWAADRVERVPVQFGWILTTRRVRR